MEYTLTFTEEELQAIKKALLLVPEDDGQATDDAYNKVHNALNSSPDTH